MEFGVGRETRSRDVFLWYLLSKFNFMTPQMPQIFVKGKFQFLQKPLLIQLFWFLVNDHDVVWLLWSFDLSTSQASKSGKQTIDDSAIQAKYREGEKSYSEKAREENSWPFKSPLRLLLLWQLCGFLTMSFPSGLMSLTTHKTWENWIAFNAWYMDGQLKNFSQSFTEKPNQKFKHQNLTFESSFLTILIIIVFLLVFLRFVERIRTALLVPNWGGEEGRNCVAAFLASPPNMSV